MLQGFKQFILKGNVVDLAVGVVIGASFSTVVSSFTKGLLTPLISAFTGSQNFSKLTFSVGNANFLYGDFLDSAIAFFLTALVLYFFVVGPMNHLLEISRLRSTTTDAATKKCPFCFSEISVKASKCAFCTSKLDDDPKKK